MKRGRSGWRRCMPVMLGAPLLFLVPPHGSSQENAGSSGPMVRFLQPRMAEAAAKALPISLDTVFRLAQDRNGQIAVARQRLEEAYAKQDIAAKQWLPDISIGTAYYRHEGGIQDFTGELIHSSYGSLFAGLELRGKLDPREAAYQRIDAARKVWQQKGDLSKLTSETLLDAAGTYVDLLTARSSVALSLSTEKQLGELVALANTLARIDPGLRVEVVRINAEIQGQKLITRKLQEGANNTAAKLIFLLGLDPDSELIVLEQRLAAFELVPMTKSSQELAAQALERGPGVRELAGLLNLIEEARAKGEGPGRFLPSVEATMAEGAFGAGPGAQMSWDNRWDLGLHLKWNLTQALTARARRRQADAQQQQVRISYQDLRAKLTLGVQEARESCLSGAEQMRLSESQIQEAENSYQLSNSRFKENIKGRSPSEVLMALRSLAGARLNYLQILRDYDKAQLRLFVLVGGQGE
jgi:outer membrane protein TolC